ncbi:MFS transporter [Sandaracinus amylolyticus]|uniref:AmpG permease n=1 Tax=Sandaracinus amylolyticus TaxID=927083 RepID=A0A0F6W3T3_9BACT|nr:MFS transporter [Sandaracinus amylolyticus]AKF06608.1 AmpG permease [Sandaracinus amylolyticus]
MSDETKRGKALAWTSSAYFGEGLPFSFLHQLVTEYLTAIGAPPSVVGYTSWFHLSVTAKPLWSPLIDLFGTRRGWMIALQLVLAVGMVLMGAMVAGGGGALETPWLFWGALAVLAAVHATHDIACDGLFMVALDRREQALYSGTRIAAYRIAMYVGSGALVVLAGRAGWTAAFTTAGALMALTAAINAWLVPRVEDRDGPEHVQPSASGFGAAYRTFLAQPEAVRVIVFVLTYRLCDVLTFAMAPVLLRDLGIGTEARGVLRSIGLTASIGGSLLAGGLLARGGLERWLVPFTYAMAIPFYLLVAWLRPSFEWIVVVYTLEQLAGALAGTALPVFLMRRCKRAFSASHYAFFSAITALTATVAGGLSGHVVEALTAAFAAGAADAASARADALVAFFALCFVAALPAVLLVHLVPTAPIEREA